MGLTVPRTTVTSRPLHRRANMATNNLRQASNMAISRCVLRWPGSEDLEAKYIWYRRLHKATTNPHRNSNHRNNNHNTDDLVSGTGDWAPSEGDIYTHIAKQNIRHADRKLQLLRSREPRCPSSATPSSSALWIWCSARLCLPVLTMYREKESSTDRNQLLLATRPASWVYQ